MPQETEAALTAVELASDRRSASSRAELSVPLLYPLTDFPDAERPAPSGVQRLAPERLPQPYRQLLAHDRDMTSTLEEFHGEVLGLRLLERRRLGTALLRQVVLIGRDSGRPVEFGAIRIDLQEFEPAARRAIELGLRPLGAILAHYRVGYESHPEGFFRLDSDRRIEEILGLSGGQSLYGRRNVLMGRQGKPLARVVEILPPV